MELVFGRTVLLHHCSQTTQLAKGAAGIGGESIGVRDVHSLDKKGAKESQGNNDRDQSSLSPLFPLPPTPKPILLPRPFTGFLLSKSV